MAKLISVFGSPGSGKTSITLKLAMETYIATKDESILVLSPDISVPGAALLFPNYDPNEICSLSTVFDNTAISAETLLKNTVTVKTMSNFGFLGFKAGDNRYSFPKPTPDKINALFNAISEIAGYLLFQHEYSANFLFTLWKRVRKYGAFCTGITQNVDDLLQSHTARTMLANSEFIIMLNQGGTDREDLANLLQISETQMTHITNVEVGHGLVKVGSALVPFERKFPKDTELYKLMSTKIKE